MKKKLALLMSALMVVGMVPATAFAVTTNTVSRVANGTVDTVLVADSPSAGEIEAPIFTIEDKSLDELTSKEVAFKVTLENAEWKVPDAEVGTVVEMPYADVNGTQNNSPDSTVDDGELAFQMLSSSQAIMYVKVYSSAATAEDSKISFPILAKLTDEGEASMTIDPMESVVTAGTYKFANVMEGSASVTIADTASIKEGVTPIETITIEEATINSLDKGGTIKLKLNSDFTWANTKDGSDDVKVTVYPSDAQSSISVKTVDDETLELTVDADATRARTITLSNLKVRADFDDIEVGEICEVTVSGAGIDKTTLEVGTATDYSVSLSAENKTVPTFYSGRADDEIDSLKVTIKENIANSWITGRKATLTFPEGVKVLDVDVTKADKIPSGGSNGVDLKIEDNEVEFETTGTPDGKMKFEMTFQFSIAPDFTGDIVAKLSGAAIGEDQEVVVGTVVSPITVEAETNKVSIDYRNVAIGDIIIKEAYAGALQKDKTLSLVLEDMKFDGDPTVEVVEGDIKIDDVDVKDGTINIKIDSESAKTPATLKVTNIELYLDRSLPAGNYKLKLAANQLINVASSANELQPGTFNKLDGEINNDLTETDPTDAFFQNSAEENDKCDKTTLFDVQDVTVLDNYVEVVTAGRDQDDSTFTTQIKVTIGANTMIVGDEEKPLDVPAYISNGYTMMPVRAVTEALSGSAIVRWDDATKTVTITFGARVISMTVGSQTMLINGVPVQMQAAVEITGAVGHERAFIPLRDLGYALGLNDTKIGWDDATKTATLN